MLYSNLIRNFVVSLLLTTALITSSPVRSQSQVEFYTNMGDFVIELYDTLMPITAGNFYKLVGEEYYDGIIFHRVIDGFMIQGGDPTGTGSGGPGYKIDDEFDSSLSNVQKTISMANSGPNTGGSQFFINLVDNTQLDFDKPPFTSKHPVFGIVISGFNIVQSIGKVSTDASDRPINEVVMDSVRIIKTIYAGTGGISNDHNSLTIFPNPATSESMISINANSSYNAGIAIRDCMGRMVAGTLMELNKGVNNISMLEITHGKLPKGLYFLVISSDHGTEVKKFLAID